MRLSVAPDRRETILCLFALTVFFLFFNLDSSIRLLGFNPEETRGIVSRRLGLDRSNFVDKDGRKPPGWRDDLEDEIFGAWGWDEGHVAGDGAERSQSKGTGRHGALWIGKGEIGSLEVGGNTTDQVLRWWHDDVPETKLLKHAPGYSILDNVILFNGSTFIVTDDLDSFPPLSSIFVSNGPGMDRWEVLSISQAKATLGIFGGILRGVTWMSGDTSPHNSTLFSLWRTYSSLDPFINALGQTTLPPPHRLIFPHNRFFADDNPPFEKHWIKRERVDTGFHPYLAKAAFPSLTMMYFEDLDDYNKIQVPFVVERLVFADQRAAASSRHLGQPVFSSPFELEASEYWWEPVRRTLSSYFGSIEEESAKKVVIYSHRQGEKSGLKLYAEDHLVLMQALKRMERDYGYEVHVLSSRTEETGWNERMGVVVKSTVMLGVYGSHLLDSMFMTRSPRTTLMEFFPTDTFARDEELVTDSLGIHYIAWWNTQKFTSDGLPPVAQPADQELHVDADAVARTIHEVLSR